MLIVLACCASCQKKTPSTKDLFLNLNMKEDFSSFDPRKVRTLKDLSIAKQLFEGLTRLDQNGIPQLALAEKIVVSEDQLTYTFFLREAYWTNQDKVTAYDFQNAWLEVLNPQFPSDYASMLYPIKNAKLARSKQCSLQDVAICAVDEKTLVVQLEKPTPYFLELTAFPTYFPVHKLQESAGNPICNGPFKVAEYEPEAAFTLEKNSLYWDASSVALPGIRFTFLTNPITESYLFETGELDWLGLPLSNGIASDIITKFKKENKLSSYPVVGTFWFKFNTEKEPFNDPLLRTAFSYALSRKDIIEHVLQGNQDIATSPVPPYLFKTSVPHFEDANLLKAREIFETILKNHEWTREDFPQITLNYNPSERNSKIAQLVQQQWEKAFGIPISLEAKELHVYRKDVKAGNYQVGTGEWIADFTDPIAFLELFKEKIDLNSGTGLNDTFWQNEEFIHLLDLASDEKNKDKRLVLLQQAEEILIREMPIAPVYHYAFDYVKNDSIDGVILSPLGIADYKYAKKIKN